MMFYIFAVYDEVEGAIINALPRDFSHPIVRNLAIILQHIQV